MVEVFYVCAQCGAFTDIASTFVADHDAQKGKSINCNRCGHAEAYPLWVSPKYLATKKGVIGNAGDSFAHGSYGYPY